MFFNQNMLAFITYDISWNFENNLMLSFAIMPFWRVWGSFSLSNLYKILKISRSPCATKWTVTPCFYLLISIWTQSCSNYPILRKFKCWHLIPPSHLKSAYLQRHNMDIILEQEALEEPISLTWNPMQLNWCHFSLKSEMSERWHLSDMASILKKKIRQLGKMFQQYHHIHHIKKLWIVRKLLSR